MLDSKHFSLEAEQAILGALLHKNEVYDLISGKLEPEHFYDPIHLDIYETIITPINDGREVNAIYLKNRYSQSSKLKDIGGVDYIALLLGAVTGRPELTIGGYAKLVIDMAKRRKAEYFIDIATHELDDYDKGADSIIEDFIGDADSLLIDKQGATKSQSSSELAASFVTRMDNDNELASCYSGFIDLDNRIGGFVAGRVYILAGRPAMGKSTVALNIARNVGSQKKGVVFLSLEMTNDGQSDRMIASIGAKMFGPFKFPSVNQLRHEWRKGNREGIQRAVNEFDAMPIEWEEGVGLSLKNIRVVTNRAIRSIRASGANLDLLIIDHIGHVAGSRRGQSNYEKVTEVSNQLIAIAKQYEVPVLALCQLSRAVEQREDKRPQLSDLRESGHIEQDASVVIGIYRDEYYAEQACKALDYNTDDKTAESAEERLRQSKNKLELVVLKNRHGNTGTANLFCELSRMLIDNSAQDYRGTA